MTYRKKSGILTAVVVILVVALLVGALAAITEGFKNWDPSTWFGRGEPTEEEQPSDAEQVVQENMIGSVATSNGISLLMAPATVMDAATGEPRAAGQTVSVSNAEEGVTYSWALSWSGSGNASDYVSLSATNGTSVTVSAKKPFGSQIKLTCTASISGKNVSSAVCNLDYKKRLTGMRLNGVSITDGGTYSLDDFTTANSFANAMKTGGCTFAVTAVYGTGSVSSTAGSSQLIDAWSSYDDYSKKYTGNSTPPKLSDICYGVGIITSSSVKTQWENGTVDAMTSMFTAYELSGTVFRFNVGLVSTDEDISGSYTIDIEYPSSWVPAFSYNVSLDTPSVIF